MSTNLFFGIKKLLILLEMTWVSEYIKCTLVLSKKGCYIFFKKNYWYSGRKFNRRYTRFWFDWIRWYPFALLLERTRYWKQRFSRKDRKFVWYDSPVFRETFTPNLHQVFCLKIIKIKILPKRYMAQKSGARFPLNPTSCWSGTELNLHIKFPV